LIANLLNKSKKLEVLGCNKPSIYYIKDWKKKKFTPLFCKYCKLRGYKDTDCAFLYPEKAPKGWKNLSKPKDN